MTDRVAYDGKDTWLVVRDALTSEKCVVAVGVAFMKILPNSFKLFSVPVGVLAGFRLLIESTLQIIADLIVCTFINANIHQRSAWIVVICNDRIFTDPIKEYIDQSLSGFILIDSKLLSS